MPEKHHHVSFYLLSDILIYKSILFFTPFCRTRYRIFINFFCHGSFPEFKPIYSSKQLELISFANLFLNVEAITFYAFISTVPFEQKSFYSKSSYYNFLRFFCAVRSLEFNFITQKVIKIKKDNVTKRRAI